MIKDQFITERTRIISEMLDNANKYGIYPTTKCFKELDELYDRITSEAIAAHEAEQWKKFPDWTPEQPSKKICQMKDGSIKIKVASYSSDWSKVMYFRDLPAAYQPEKGGGG